MEKGIIVMSGVDISYYEDKLAQILALHPEIILVTPETMVDTPVTLGSIINIEPQAWVYPTKEKKPWSKRTPRKFGGIRTR